MNGESCQWMCQTVTEKMHCDLWTPTLIHVMQFLRQNLQNQDTMQPFKQLYRVNERVRALECAAFFLDWNACLFPISFAFACNEAKHHFYAYELQLLNEYFDSYVNRISKIRAICFWNVAKLMVSGVIVSKYYVPLPEVKYILLTWKSHVLGFMSLMILNCDCDDLYWSSNYDRDRLVV